MSDKRAFDDTAMASDPSKASETLDRPLADPSMPSLATGLEMLAGRYELLSLIGVGGMGAVYRARDVELDEIVALKMLRSELMAEANHLLRFRQEVKLARKVTHRNVARTFDIGEHGGKKFLTMEFIEGESLAARLARTGPLPMAEMVEVVDAVCAGLTAAHAVGVVHRDLKPDNVLIALDGRVVITDFGIARAAIGAGGSAVKTMGMPLGTPAYMAPEQVEGSADIDARTDIYALGAMLFELLTGDRAWDGDSAFAVAAKRLVCNPPDPRVKRPELPDAMARLVIKCMAKNREDRFTSTAEVARVLAGLTLPAPAAKPPPANAKMSPTEATQAGVKTVAVLPFRNGSAKEDDYLAEGLTDDLIDALSMTQGLKVRPRGLVAAWKGLDRDPREIGAQLGVEVVVEGSVRRAGERLRVNARVISVADGFQLWAQRFDRAAGDVLAVGEETARAVAVALTVRPGSTSGDAPTDPLAIDLYLRARHEYHKHWGDNITLAIDLFRQALARSPDNALILAGYSMALMRSFALNTSADHLADQGMNAARRAQALAPHLGEPSVAMAIYHRNIGDPVSAAREARQAIVKAPSLADAYDIQGNLLIEVGAPDEGILTLRTALTCDPRLIPCRFDMGRAYALLGQHKASEEAFGPEPQDKGLGTLYWVNRCRIAMWFGNIDDARRWLPQLDVPGTFGGVLTMLKLTLGQSLHDQELDFLNLLALPSGLSLRRRVFFNQIRTEVASRTSNPDGALSALAAADAAGLFDITWLDRCPLLAPLRTDRRFEEVRAHVADRAAKVRDALGVALSHNVRPAQ
jgi:TolB-like protein